MPAVLAAAARCVSPIVGRGAAVRLLGAPPRGGRRARPAERRRLGWATRCWRAPCQALAVAVVYAAGAARLPAVRAVAAWRCRGLARGRGVHAAAAAAGRSAVHVDAAAAGGGRCAGRSARAARWARIPRSIRWPTRRRAPPARTPRWTGWGRPCGWSSTTPPLRRAAGPAAGVAGPRARPCAAPAHAQGRALVRGDRRARDPAGAGSGLAGSAGVGCSRPRAVPVVLACALTAAIAAAAGREPDLTPDRGRGRLGGPAGHARSGRHGGAAAEAGAHQPLQPGAAAAGRCGCCSTTRR